ncbi:hypothetical protein H6781_01660 [Candidatus Nomurabacteria bacterium]|nr:hypothetical protein [Candidatus Kaiserbacteria bacterium]MCB9810287.1 hypothetical protein [Candidatus Nomurabacteria bacterium]
MKKFLNIFFVTLGVIFFGIILLAIYFYIADPLNLKPIIFADKVIREVTEDTVLSEVGEASEEVDKNPALSDGQEKLLETVGIDPALVPSQISAEQESCFVEVLGAGRVQEIKDGDTPTVTEFFKAKECLNN